MVGTWEEESVTWQVTLLVGNCVTLYFVLCTLHVRTYVCMCTTDIT